MTFEELQATRKEVSDLGAAIEDDAYNGLPGYVYLGVLWIEKAPEEGWEFARDPGVYHLQIERDEYFSNDLSNLESKLHRWARSAGYFEHYVHVVGPHDSGFIGPFVDAASADRYREIEAKDRQQFTLATISQADMLANVAEFGASPIQRPDRDRQRSALIAEYQGWMKAEGLGLGSGDEHHHDETLTQEQRDWLRDFSAQWEANEQGKA